MTEKVKIRNRTLLGRDGKRVYFIDNVRTTKAKYEEIMGEVVEQAEAPKEAIVENCPFDGKEGTRLKFVNFKKIRLCEDHYQTKTTGEIVQKLRDNDK